MKISTFLIISFVVLVVVGFILSNHEGRAQQNNSLNPEYQPNVSSPANYTPIYKEPDSGYPKWTHFPVSYYFTDGNVCGNYELNRMRRAFSIIANETRNAISFVEKNGGGDINVICSKDYKVGTEPGTYISGEGGYGVRGNEIVSGLIDLSNMGGGKYTGGCINIPNIEIHEIMHVFALQHSENSHSIMYPISGSNICVLNHIDNETLQILNDIYHFK
jgi:hypothetical protein